MYELDQDMTGELSIRLNGNSRSRSSKRFCSIFWCQIDYDVIIDLIYPLFVLKYYEGIINIMFLTFHLNSYNTQSRYLCSIYRRGQEHSILEKLYAFWIYLFSSLKKSFFIEALVRKLNLKFQKFVGLFQLLDLDLKSK